MRNTSPLGLNTSPGVGFDQPFDLLQGCHERVQRSLALLRRLRLHVQAMGADDQARQAAQDVLRYFDLAAPAHHEDEERHVFPLLLRLGRHVQEIQRLQREHQDMAHCWSRVRERLKLLEDGQLQRLTADDEALLQQFDSLYEWHLATENELIFPQARSQCDEAVQAAMGREMAQRRGLP